MSTSPVGAAAVNRAFQFKILPNPTITPALRYKAIGAYQHIASRYSFLTPDVRLGARVGELTGLNRTGYDEFELNLNSVLLGTILNSLVCGSMMFFGPPGSGKTMVPEVVGQVLFGKTLREIEQATIYCHPNLTEEKMVAHFDIPKLMAGQRKVIWSPWVLEFYRMLDEVNRMAPETTAILMQAIDRRRVAYAQEEVKDMPYGPVFATANYYDAGNFEMTRPFLDRFGLSVHTEGLSPQQIDLLYLQMEELDRQSFALSSQEEREQVWAEIQSIGTSHQTLSRLAHLASGLFSCDLAGNHWYDKHKGRFGDHKVECATAEPNKAPCGFNPANVVCSQIKEQGLTTRALLALRDYSRALAWFLGRSVVDDEIMKITFALVNSHRLTPSKTAMNGGESAEGTSIMRDKFSRRTLDFGQHLWEMSRAGFQAQETILNKVDQFFKDIVQSEKTAADLLKESEEILRQVDAMEDPAKWEILKALHSARETLKYHNSISQFFDKVAARGKKKKGKPEAVGPLLHEAEQLLIQMQLQLDMSQSENTQLRDKLQEAITELKALPEG